tara:strand:- start:4536 stop:4820 length:285 start_codon:yes stop_codon:yes gene_type:complete
MKESQIILQGTTPEALAELIDSKLEVRLNELQKNFTPSDPDILLTRDDVCKLLHIDPSTLWHWQNKGKVKCYAIGNRRYYKRSEIMESLTLLSK